MSSQDWNNLNKQERTKLLASAGLPTGLSQLSWSGLQKSERAKIEKLSKVKGAQDTKKQEPKRKSESTKGGGKGWREEQQEVRTDKGIEKKAPIHRKVALEKEASEANNTPMEKKPIHEEQTVASKPEENSHTEEKAQEEPSKWNFNLWEKAHEDTLSTRWEIPKIGGGRDEQVTISWSDKRQRWEVGFRGLNHSELPEAKGFQEQPKANEYAKEYMDSHPKGSEVEGKAITKPIQPEKQPLEIVNTSGTLILTTGGKEYRAGALQAKGFMETTIFYEFIYHSPYHTTVPSGSIEYQTILNYFKNNMTYSDKKATTTKDEVIEPSGKYFVTIGLGKSKRREYVNDAHPFEVRWIKLFSRNVDGIWQVTEQSTGVQIASGRTRKEAESNATDLIKNGDPEALMNKLKRIESSKTPRDLLDENLAEQQRKKEEEQEKEKKAREKWVAEARNKPARKPAKTPEIEFNTDAPITNETEGLLIRGLTKEQAEEFKKELKEKVRSIKVEISIRVGAGGKYELYTQVPIDPKSINGALTLFTKRFGKKPERKAKNKPVHESTPLLIEYKCGDEPPVKVPIEKLGEEIKKCKEERDEFDKWREQNAPKVVKESWNLHGGGT